VTGSALFSLIIPAHNEEAVIERCLKTAREGAPGTNPFEIVVAANGCTDRTVEFARRAAPDARILDLPAGSKTRAINSANAAASAFPRIYLDADVECDFHSLSAIADALREPGVMAAAPSIRLDLSHGNWLIRSYYSAWMKQPFAKAGKGGAGCYGLSEAALKQVGRFPDIIGDDIWIHTRFPDVQKRYITEDRAGRPVFSVVRPPSTAWGQVKVEARRMVGNAEVRRDHPSPYFRDANKDGGLIGAFKSGASPLDLLVFIAVKALVRLQTRRILASGARKVWSRDLSSREHQS
jgi:glycosyltransferase involved in cell wall biosynthesis